ncbi:MAG: iron-sulfur cluster assembly protein, partial [Roseobacter sp.]
MPLSKSDVESALARVMLPDGKSILDHDLIRALTVEGDVVRFVIEAPNAQVAAQMAPLRDAAEAVVREVDGVGS